MSNTKNTHLDEASHGGGIGDIPAQPVNPSSPNSGETDPILNSDGVDTHPDGDEADGEAEGQPS